LSTPIEAAVPPASPVADSHRIATLDVIRGVALMGILVVNMEFFALPMSVYFNPASWGGFEGFSKTYYIIESTVFFNKMMSIFSMLFGAGIALMFHRFEQSGRKFGGIHYRRMLWLMLIGLVHAYLLWYGDILFSYALCGMLLFLFRRKTPRTLIIWAVVFMIISSGIQLGAGFGLGQLQSAYEKAKSGELTEEEIGPSAMAQINQWEEVEAQFDPPVEKIQEEIDAYQGGFASCFEMRAPQSVGMQTSAFFFFVLWRVMGVMLLGMALLKMGFLAAEKSKRTYWTTAAIGYGIGLPLVIYSDMQTLGEFDVMTFFVHQGLFFEPGSTLVSLGHLSLIILICKAGVLTWLRERFAAAGRMALTNYLMQTVLCTTLFYGYGGGLFGEVERAWFGPIVLAVWAVQLAWSKPWLDRYKFGPVEWLWRSLTYWKRQPMQARETSATFPNS